MFKNYKDSLFNDEVIIRSQQRFRSDHHKVCTEEVNKIALSSNDDKRIQTFDKVTTYPYGTNTFMACENEMKYKPQRKKMKYILQRKMSNIDLKALTDKSLLLRNEAQALRTNSFLLRNELKKLRAVCHDIKTKSYILRTESQMLRAKSNESHSLREKSLSLGNEVQALRTNSFFLRNELKELRAVSRVIKTKSCMLRTESQMLRNKSVKSEIDIIIDSSQKLRKESAQIIFSLQKLREELRVIREESLQIIDRSRKLRKNDIEINDNDEEMAYIEMLNKLIDKVNEFKLTEFSYPLYINKKNEILIVLSDDDKIYEDPWLKLNELYKINALIDELLDKIWKLATVRNRKAGKN